jgi:sialate O-acetylesterase
MRITSIAATLLVLAALPACADPILYGPGFQESGYSLVYAISPPSHSDFGTIPYQVNNSAEVPTGSFTRIGYYVEYEIGAGPLEWVSVSMDAFTDNAALIGVPTQAADVFNDVAVTNMDVFSDVAGVTTGTGLSNGFVQFWPYCYGHTGGGYATGDDTSSNSTFCYGSMQIGDGVGHTVFAYNSFEDAGDGDLGIGNDPSGGNPDWTFANNIQTMSVKEVEVFVNDQSVGTPEPGTILLLASGLGMIARRRRKGALSEPSAVADGSV